MKKPSYIPEELVPHYCIAKDSSFTIRDLVSKAPVARGTVPKFITDTTYYAAGMEYLQAYALTTKVTIRFSRHKSPADMGAETLRAAILDVDLYIPEAINWDDDAYNFFNDIAERPARMSEAELQTFLKANYDTPDESIKYFIRTIDATKTPIDFVDISEHDFKHIKGLEDLWTLVREHSFNSTYTSTYSIFYWQALYLYYREWIMVARLGQNIHYWVTEQGVKASKLKVLMTLGTLHYGVIDKLKLLDVECDEVLINNFANQQQAQNVIQQANIYSKYTYTQKDVNMFEALNDIFK